MLSFSDRLRCLVASDSAVRCLRWPTACPQHTLPYFRHPLHNNNNNNSNNGDNSERTERGSLEQQCTCVRPSLRVGGYTLAIYFDLHTGESLAKGKEGECLASFDSR
uniref:Uncharacterized protein n=1 Tax=Anopheles triannulatus TaxID=58253 RepID=A0A2M4AZ25_9DIPT